MTENLAFNVETAWNHIRTQLNTDGISTREAFESLIETYVDERVNRGELDPDQNIDHIVESLKAKWDEWSEQL